MTAKNRFAAFIRGYCSVIELQPTSSRKAARDAIIDAQANNLYDIWSQVGDLLREAQSEFPGKNAARPRACGYAMADSDGPSGRHDV